MLSCPLCPPLNAGKWQYYDLCIAVMVSLTYHDKEYRFLEDLRIFHFDKWETEKENILRMLNANCNLRWFFIILFFINFYLAFTSIITNFFDHKHLPSSSWLRIYKDVWYWIIKWCEISNNQFNLVRGLIDFAASWENCPKKREILNMIFYTKFWNVWIARNGKTWSL